MPDFDVLRSRMVRNQLRTFDVTDLDVQAAFAKVPREIFVSPAQRPIAYSDDILRITEGATPRAMMPPATLARIIQALAVGRNDVALVVGAGTGYSAAILADLASSVIALDCDPALADRASGAMDELGVMNVAVVTGALPDGYPSDAPYDVVFVDGAVEAHLDALKGQLKDGGRMAAVEGRGLAGRATLYRRSGEAVSGWPLFSAAAPLLPGFERPQEFVL